MSSFAEMERNRLGERIRGTKQLKMKENVYLGGPVGFGYTVEQVNDKTYVLENPSEQKIIEKMKKLRKDGLSFRKISEVLKKDKVSLSHTGVSNILRDELKQKMKLKKVKETIKKVKK
jgi:DNA invertase Pin-like site-specific DNA recombinase